MDNEKVSRKVIKKRAKHSLKEHYGIWVLICLISLLVAGESILPKNMITLSSEEASDSLDINVESSNLSDRLVEVISNIADDRIEEERASINDAMQQRIDSTDEAAALGYSRGALSAIVNRVSSGSLFLVIGTALASLFGSNAVGAVFMILLTLVVALAVWILFLNIYSVMMARMFLEGHYYPRIHLTRLGFVFRSGNWIQVAKTMLLKEIYSFLWSLTIVGGIIKHYSYLLVPYIAAENPSMSAKEVITLSRKMMNGHKWECFILEMSFFGWEVLNVVTFGLLRMLFILPYEEATFCEYYIELRTRGKQNHIEGIDMLHDDLLYEPADSAALKEAYPKVFNDKEREKLQQDEASMHGFAYFLAKNFGILLTHSEVSRRFEANQVYRQKLYYQTEAFEGKVYPDRLNEFSHSKFNEPSHDLNAFRCYTIWSVILIFFTMSFLGWCWEVSLHILTDGEFVNRGVLHGPWLPIYGTGSIVVLILLYRLRENPIMEFVMTIVVCGFVEYFTAFYLEKTYDGTKWWDYSGYFLNLHGRICAEGLLVFGIGGMVIIYLIAPRLDNLFRKINFKALVAICLILLTVYFVDNTYSGRHPNTGKGITSYGEEADTASLPVA